MPNSPATSTARRGSIFRLQLASLLRPQDTARLMGGLSLRGSLLRSLGARPRSKSQGSVPTVRSSKSKLPEPQVKATENNLKIRVSLDPTTALPMPAKTASTAERSASSSAQAAVAQPRLSAALLNPGLSTIISGLVVVLVGVLDYITGPHVSMAIVYLLPVIFTAWFAGKNNGILVAIMASLVWVSADV